MSAGRSRRIVLLPAAALVALGLAFAWRHLLPPRLAARAARALSARLHEPITVADATLAWPAIVRLREVHGARAQASSLAIELSLDALARGRAEPLRAEAVDVTVKGRAAADRAEWRPDGEGGSRVVLRGARSLERPVAADEVRLFLDADRSVRAVTVEDGAAFGLRRLHADAWREADGWTVDVRSTSASGRLHVSSDRARFDGAMVFDGAGPLAFSRDGIDAAAARLDGTLRAAGDADAVNVSIALAAEGVALTHLALAARRVSGLSGSIAGDARVDHHGRRIATSGLALRLGAASAALGGTIDRDGASDVRLDVARAPCAALLAALAPLAPALDGLALAGEAEAHARVTADARRLDDLALDSDVDIACRVEREPFLFDDVALDEGPPRPLAAGDFRPLDSLPSSLVRAFVAAEDARFFEHHGFDAWTIRRALAADLAATAFDRGASTISQQVTKNLFLDGERTVSRKLEEAVLAWRLEQRLPKRRILELYFDLVEMAPEVRGVAAGARHWFGADVTTLTLDQAAQLAALLPAPRRGMDDAWSRRYRDLDARLARGELARLPPR